MSTCSFPDCGASIMALGLCSGHYHQQHRGHPLKPIARDRTTAERFWSKVTRSSPNDCWLWTGAVGGHGYGNFWADGRYYRAHRWSYENCVGPIPDGLTLDHVRARGCRSKLCVNPAHLEPVTSALNTERGDALKNALAKKAAQDTCKHGHPLSGDNLYVQPKNGYRYCRTCQKRRRSEYLVRQRTGLA